jgi:hypothetical protein
MIALVSVVVAVAGLAASAAVRRRLTRVEDAHVDWALGVAALVPAWLVAVLGLLGPTVRPRLTVITAVALLGTIVAVLGGAITTEARVRADAVSGRMSRARAWRLGLLAVAPAWLVALAGALLR